MAAERVLIDTGPLVALLNRKDAAHEACSAAVANLVRPMVSSWAVLAEAAWLLRDTGDGLQGLMRTVAEGVVECPPLDASAAEWIGTCQARYADLRPQLADLTLLCLAHRQKIDVIFTLDRRDFLVFKSSKNKAFRLIPADVP